MASLSPQVVSTLKERVDAASADQETGLPGSVVVVVGRDGKERFAYAGGKRGYGSSEPMTLDSIFWIASCTKMIVGIACMQLVEDNRLALDDASQVEKLCPELKQVKVLQDDGQLVEKKRGITLRMLLSHTGKIAVMKQYQLDFASDKGHEQLDSATRFSTRSYETTVSRSGTTNSPDTCTIYYSPW
jgi:CubicO group peptidase (beta-lactamase class C family)